MKTTREVVRVNGKLKEIVTLQDETGKIIHKIVSPLMVEFYFRDVLQVIIGATILAIPVAFTEETWRLGEKLQLVNISALGVLSVIFIALFVYYNYYQERLHDHKLEFAKRVISTYVLSLLVVALILTLIDQAPWATNFTIALKRSVIIAFPASLSAAVADILR